MALWPRYLRQEFEAKANETIFELIAEDLSQRARMLKR
jgi:hypothetical protein